LGSKHIFDRSWSHEVIGHVAIRFPIGLFVFASCFR